MARDMERREYEVEKVGKGAQNILSTWLDLCYSVFCGEKLMFSWTRTLL